MTVAIVGISAVIVTVFGYVAELYLERCRESFPHWADSIGVPLADVPIIFVILFLWYVLNLIGFKNPYKTGGCIKNLKLEGINYWFLIHLIVTFRLTVILIFEGAFWLVSAGILWSYFYLCLLVGRRDGVIDYKTKLTL